ncbi:hypothetical protein DM02DRAFT_632215 [Periconia macrospinosa]|uniref:F-box domain-containing protein n=1 Tax=Periconia macrospinosa TaxID=97972 RepID=A0A2V1DDN9_9PLEO|nr:hypothetical protein DM02DRAFT_632215 [Periconia macrospinosa]
MSPFSVEHNIPQEVIDIILSHCTQGSLITLSRCSKKMNRIVTPSLYREICFRPRTTRVNPQLPKRHVDEHGRATLSTMQWFLPFAHLMLMSPGHASYVRSLTIENLEEPLVLEGNRPWPESDIQILHHSLTRVCQKCTTSEEDAHEVFELVRSGDDWNAVFALFFMHLGNLQRLCFPPGSGYSHFAPACEKGLVRVLRLVARGREGGSAAVQDSTPLDIMFSVDTLRRPRTQVEIVAFLLNRPNIRSLYAWKLDLGVGRSYLDDVEQGNGILQLKPCSLGVEFIELRESAFNHEHFHHLMQAVIPGALKTLIFTPERFYVDNHDPKQVLESLRAHHSTLERLDLPNILKIPSNGAPISFQAFKNLRKLKVAPVYIWGSNGLLRKAAVRDPSSIPMLRDALPSTLDELWITNVDAEDRHPGYITTLILPALSLLISHRDDSFPHLTHVCVSFRTTICYGYQPADLTWLQVLHPLALSAQKQGITLTINPRAEDEYRGEFLSVVRPWGWHEDVEWTDQTCPYDEPETFSRRIALSRRIAIAEVSDVLDAVGEVIVVADGMEP